MARPRNPENAHLPSGVRKSRGWHFWVDPATEQWHKLGKAWDMAARDKWVKLSSGKAAAGSVADMLDDHMEHRLQLVREKKMAARTYDDNLDYLRYLKAVFGAQRPADLNGRHISAYLEKRSWQPPARKGPDGEKFTPPPQRAPVRANKEISLLSSAYEWALKSPKFPTVKSNPCYGVKRNPTKRSERAPEQWELEAAKLKATPMWALILDLAYIGGKRGVEMRMLPKKAVQADGLHVEGAKNGPEVIIEWSEDLHDVILRIYAWSEAIEERRHIASPYLIQARGGGAYTRHGWKTMMYKIVRTAIADPANPLTEAFSFHSIRASSATDEEEIYGTNPQHRLGHKKRSTTDIYIRGRRPKKVKPMPLKRANGTGN